MQPGARRSRTRPATTSPGSRSWAWSRRAELAGSSAEFSDWSGVTAAHTIEAARPGSRPPTMHRSDAGGSGGPGVRDAPPPCTPGRGAGRRVGQADAAFLRASARCRRSRRRSRSERPPQIPNFSAWSSAYSRHSARTSQLPQTRLGFAGRRAAFGEEEVGIDPEAVGALLPAALRFLPVRIEVGGRGCRRRADRARTSCAGCRNGSRGWTGLSICRLPSCTVWRIGRPLTLDEMTPMELQRCYSDRCTGVAQGVFCGVSGRFRSAFWQETARNHRHDPGRLARSDPEVAGQTLRLSVVPACFAASTSRIVCTSAVGSHGLTT